MFFVTSCITTFVLLFGFVSSSHHEDSIVQSDVKKKFDSWLRRSQRSQMYANNQTYYQHRLRIFAQNHALVTRHNAAFDAGYTSYRMRMHDSPFADWTDEEFATLYLMTPQNCSATTTSITPSAQQRLRPLDDDEEEALQSTKHKEYSIDWRTKGIVTPIKNQGHCGSCWTFSTTGCLEAHLCLAHNKDCTSWTGLAEQQLVDCAGAFNNFGCNGGLPSQAYEYIKFHHGIDLEDSYKYVANNTDGICKATTSGIGQVAEVFNITSNDEDDLVYAVANVGPVSIAYQVSPDFRFYSHGVYDSFNATTNATMCHSAPYDVNHAVVAVGLGTTKGKSGDGDVPYYIVRNSWGTEWGMEGYFWMKRGENLCGVSDCASFPLVPVVTTRLRKSGTPTTLIDSQ